MVTLKNMGHKAFLKYIQDKTVYLFGAGIAMEGCLSVYFENKDIAAVVDNSEKLWGKEIIHRGNSISIISRPQLADELSRNGIDNTILLISSPDYAYDILEGLDQVPELDGLECYANVLIRNTKEEIPPYEFTNGEPIIPKKIHYIWVGGKELPDKYKANIETWHKYNPDYEIIEWNERNYDFMATNYVREAYETGMFGFTVNYVRLDVVYNHGGIYLDTDVECVNSFDALLADEAFFNMGCGNLIDMGCGFGAVPHNELVGLLRDKFGNSHFTDQYGKAQKRPNYSFVNPVLKQYGFPLINECQRRGNTVIYPCEVMSPLMSRNMDDFISSQTLSIHREDGSWRTGQESMEDQTIDRLLSRVED